MRILIAAGVALLALAGARPAAAATISVYPAPGTPLAMPATQISFRGAPEVQLGPIVVTGSRSGRHQGTLRAHSDGNGASFVPKRRFTPGERVTVRTALDIVGVKSGDFGFTIGIGHDGRPACRRAAARRPRRRPVLRVAARADAARRRDPRRQAWSRRRTGVRRAQGRPWPRRADDHRRQRPAGLVQSVRRRQSATDFRVQSYQGRPALTWWEGRLFTGDGAGTGVIYDTSYRRIAAVRAGNGYAFDLHEFTITPRGTALITVYQRVQARTCATGAGRSDGRDRRRRRAGDRHQDRARALRVARGRQRRAVGVVHPGARRRAASSGTTCTSTRPPRTADGNLIVSGRNTSDDLQGRPRDRARFAGASAARSRTSSSARACASTGSTTCPRAPTGRSAIYDNSAAPAEAQALARAHGPSSTEAARTATLVHAFAHPRRAALRRARATSSCCPTATSSSAGARSAGSREFTPAAASCCSTAAWPAATTPTARSASRGAGARPDAAAARGRRRRRPDDRAGELERRDRGRPLAAARRPEPRRADPVADGPATGFETAISGATAQPLRRDAGARRRGQRPRHVAAGQAGDGLSPGPPITEAPRESGWRAASWPHAASMSRPRVRRTVARRPCSSSAALNASIAPREEPS